MATARKKSTGSSKPRKPSTRAANPSGSNYPASVPGTPGRASNYKTLGAASRASGRGPDSDATQRIFRSVTAPRAATAPASAPRSSYPAAPSSTRKRRAR